MISTVCVNPSLDPIWTEFYAACGGANCIYQDLEMLKEKEVHNFGWNVNLTKKRLINV